MSVSFNKNGIIFADIVSEALRNPFDTNLYYESDNSVWIRIVHHNNPAAAIFSSTDPFTMSVYKDANCWFMAALCDSVSEWELMIIQAAESSSTAQKYRWIQSVNPMTAAFADVAAANITKITTTGYTTPATKFGGLYKRNDKTFLSCSDGAANDYWCDFGGWTAYQGGIPGYNEVVIKSGYIDLYLRIDKVSSVDKASVYKDKILTNSIIEV